MTMKNYRIAEHPYWHAARCAWNTTGRIGGVAWREFVKPMAIVACGIVIGLPLAQIFGSAIGNLWK